MLKVRKSVVAGSFYSENPDDLSMNLDLLYGKALKREISNPIAAISPHAGHVYSGVAMASLFKNIKLPDVILILSPNHTGAGSRCSVSSSDVWEIPTAEVKVDIDAAKKIVDGSFVAKFEDTAHLKEHSIEVILPFIMKNNPKAKIIPITISKMSLKDCEKFANELVEKFGKNIFYLASSDMNHFEDDSTTKEKDSLALDAITKLDSNELYETCHENEISMCGLVPATIITIISKKLGAKKGEIIQHYNSGDVSHDHDSVVGYASVVFL